MSTKHVSVPISKLRTDSPELGIFEAYASVFGNVDSYNERVMPGAFERSLQHWRASGKRIPILWSHQLDNLDAHIGEVIEAREDGHGLWVRGQIDLEEPYGQKIYRKMRRRLINEFSFAFSVDDANVSDDGYKELHAVDLWEISVVYKGANPRTELLDIKAHATPRLDAARLSLESVQLQPRPRLWEAIETLSKL